MIRGNPGDGSTESGIGSSGGNDDEATGGDDRGVIPLKGGISHGRGMRSRDEGPTYCFTDGLDCYDPGPYHQFSTILFCALGHLFPTCSLTRRSDRHQIT